VRGAGYVLFLKTEDDCLKVRAIGQRTLDTVSTMTLEVAEAAAAAQVRNVLIDVRQLKGRLRLLDNYLLVNSVFDLLRGKGLRKAAIVDEGRPAVGTWVLETIARNRGFDLRVFDSDEDAVGWLATSREGGRKAEVPADAA
jgi:hypothetical protein